MKILIADDHPLFRSALKGILEGMAPEVEVIESVDFPTVLREVETRNGEVDLVLLDLAMPGMDGFLAIELLGDRHPALPVVVLSASENPHDMRRAMDLGVLGYLPKTLPPEVLMGEIQRALSGESLIPEALQQGLDEEELLAGQALTPRQVDVLRLMRDGKSNKEIALVLGLSPATVKVHAASIFKSLDVRNRTQAAMVAERMGLL
ncbi:MAG: response regulator transcription factor [Magnetococcales bacterium]|nr:response regulator transcription factor [Magnetococcales bacterium]